jgi:hypothetical protein
MKLSITAKCSDLFSATLSDAAGQLGKDYSGYVPDWMPGEHYGDYVQLDIDPFTGQILNWKKPSKAAIFKTFQIKMKKPELTPQS